MGNSFMRDPKKLKTYVDRRTKASTSKEDGSGTFDAPVEDGATSTPSPTPLVVPRLEGMAMQSGGFMRSARAQPQITPMSISNRSGFMRDPQAHDRQMVLKEPMMPQAAESSDAFKLMEAPSVVPLIDSSSLDVEDILGAERVAKFTMSMYMGMSEHELNSELRKLYDVFMAGFVQQIEYQQRKEEVEYYLNTVKSRGINKGNNKRKAQVSSAGRRKRKERAVRLFLSSTFRDMQGERDELVKYTFPRIKQFCADRGIFFTEVDLRWGITAEQSERGEVLELCLGEIDKCRPYFINFIGQRYGYVPQQIPEAIQQKYSWLPDTSIEENTKSVTEFEVMYGALNDTTKATRAHFYLKTGSGGDNPEKLEALKSRIRGSGLPCRDYGVPKELAQMVENDLKAAINSDFPSAEAPSPLELENMSHDTYADIRARVYIGKSEYFSRIENYVNDGTSVPLVILGESGSGKSSLVSNWYRQHERENADDLVILHFVGTSPGSADHINLIRRIMSTFKFDFDVDEEVPTDARQITKDFPKWLGYVPEGKRAILVLDALNQMEDTDNALDLHWLPTEFPRNVRLIVSTLSNCRCFDALMKRKWKTMKVEPLERNEREALALEYLSLFGKSLDSEQMHRIVTSPQTKNPLYLRALLEELRLHGVYEEISAKIEHYLRAKTIPQLYEKILERLEQDYDTTFSNLVRDTMSLMWVSRRGVYESEIIDAIGVPRMLFSPFYFAIQESLVSRAGLLNFFHDYLRQAVETRYLSTPSDKINQQLRLASYFEDSQSNINRKADELPWLLSRSQSWARLQKCLSEPHMFIKLYSKSTKYELKGYWLQLQNMYDPSQIYIKMVQHYESTRPEQEKLAQMYAKVGRFLREYIRYTEATSMLQRSLDLHTKLFGEEHLSVAKSNYLLAELYWNQGNWEVAEPYVKKALSIREKVLGPDHPTVAMALCGLGEMQMRKDSLVAAKEMIERALRIRVKHYGSEHPLVARCLQDLAIIADNSGYSDKAIELCSRALSIREKALGPGHPHVATSLESLGSIYKIKGESNKADPLMRRALEINVAIHGEIHPSVVSCCEWLALILKDLNQYDEAVQFQQRAQQIQEVTGEVGERIAD